MKKLKLRIDLTGQWEGENKIKTSVKKANLQDSLRDTSSNEKICLEEKLLVSVIVPVYNDEKYIRDCIFSLLAQQYAKKEIIIIFDQGSTDESWEILKEYAPHPEVRLFSVPHCTIGQALNYGMKVATGSIIAFAESDKVFNPLWLKNAVNYLTEHRDIDGVGSIALPPETNSLTGKCLAEIKKITIQRYLNSDKNIEWAYVYRKTSVERVGGWNEKLIVGEDRELAKRIISRGGKLYLIPIADNIHYLSGAYDGILILLKKQFRTGRNHSQQGVSSMRYGWILSLSSLLGITLVIMSIFLPSVLLWGVLLLSLEYMARLFRFIKLGKDLNFLYLPLLPILTVLMNLAYGSGRLYGYILRPSRPLNQPRLQG